MPLRTTDNTCPDKNVTIYAVWFGTSRIWQTKSRNGIYSYESVVISVMPNLFRHLETGLDVFQSYFIDPETSSG